MYAVRSVPTLGCDPAFTLHGPHLDAGRSFTERRLAKNDGDQ
jgi:hypothetical protein